MTNSPLSLPLVCLTDTLDLVTVTEFLPVRPYVLLTARTIRPSPDLGISQMAGLGLERLRDGSIFTLS